MDSGETECCFLWFVENYSYSTPIFNGYLVSPNFAPQGLGGSSWNIRVSQAILNCKNKPLHSLFLKRSATDAGPENLSLKFEISIITADGSTLYLEECECAFSKGDVRGFKAYVDMDELYAGKNTEFLPGDTLGVRFRMWRGEGTARTVTQLTTRTRIGIEKISFIHRVEKFSALKPEERKTIQIPIYANDGCVFSSSVYISNVGETVNFQIVPSDTDYRIWKIKLSLLDVFGNTAEIGEVDYRFTNHKTDLDKLERRVTKQFLLDKRREYLQNDQLSLLCECTYTNGFARAVLEETVFEIPMVEYNRRYHNSYITDVMLKSNTFCKNCNAPSTSFVAQHQMTDNNPHQGECSSADKVPTLPSVQDDLEALYHKQVLTDVALKTATKSFPAHKTVLCVRSSVFSSMLTNDMREKNTDCIRVEDLDDETVERLLLFLYSDHLEELRWESALRLYRAADKYAIERLKVLCSSFLVENVSTSNACELLLLADTHSDAELKQSVEDFILEHEKQVFCSVEWDKLSETNPQLVIKTMKLKYKREKGGK